MKQAVKNLRFLITASLVTLSGFVLCNPSFAQTRAQAPSPAGSLGPATTRQPASIVSGEIDAATEFYTDLYVPLFVPGTAIDRVSPRNGLWVHNSSFSPANLQIFLIRLNRSNPNPAVYNDTLAAGETRNYDRPAENLFGEPGASVLRVVSDRRLYVRSWLGSGPSQPGEGRGETAMHGAGIAPLPVRAGQLPRPTAEGSSTAVAESRLEIIQELARQYFAAVPASFAVSAGRRFKLLGVHEPFSPGKAPRGLPVGLVETTGDVVTVRITAVDETGNAISSKDCGLAGFEARQYNLEEFFSGAGAGKVRLEAEVLSGQGSVIAFGVGLIKDTGLGAGGEKSKSLDTISRGESKLGTIHDPLAAPKGFLASAKAAQDGSITGSGTSGQISMWTDGKTLGNSALAQDSAGNLGIGGKDGATRFSVYATSLDALQGVSTDGIGVHGTTRSGQGVVGISPAEGTGVRGRSSSGIGVEGISADGRGVEGRSDNQGGVVGISDKSVGVAGESNTQSGVVGKTNGAYGVLGRAEMGATAGVHGLGVMGSSNGVQGEADGDGRGVYGKAMSGVGVLGESSSGRGIEGRSDSKGGVVGVSNSAVGVAGESNSESGVLGTSKSGNGVEGRSDSKDGVFGQSTNQRGVHGESSGSGDGVFGESASGPGVHGKSSGGGDGVFGESASGTALHGKSSGTGDAILGEGTSGYGLHGKSADAPGVFGESSSAFGVSGQSDSGAGAGGLSKSSYGVAGKSEGSGSNAIGVYGTCDQCYGVVGRSTSSYGVRGRSESSTGVSGLSDSGIGVEGVSDSLTGVRGASTSATGVLGTSKSGAGVFGVSDGDVGVHGQGDAKGGVMGQSNGGVGVEGVSMTFRGVKGTSENIGVEGRSMAGRGIQGVSGTEIGVAGFSTSLYGVQGQSTSGDGVLGVSTSGRGLEGQSDSRGGVAGFSNSGIGVGGVSVSGDGVFGMASLNEGVAAGRFSGRLIAAIKLFQIDHPLDPANKYLNHASVESSEMKNFYDGVATLNHNGEAVVSLPEWFQALNRDFRYQLTALDAPGPNLYIAEKLADNHFKIGGGAPGMEVSWQVTGIRHDAWAEAHPFEVEQAKTQSERGTYLNPELFGQPEEQSVLWVHHPDLMRQLKRMKEAKQGAAPSAKPAW